MNLLFVIKPYEIEVYSETDKKVLLGKESITRIEHESDSDYENRMVFVCRGLAEDAKKHVKGISGITVVLCYPWCTYEHIDLHKTFDTDTLVTERLIESLKMQKKEDSILLLEAEHSHILLNGYAVENPFKQKAREIEMQVLNVYVKASFGNALKNTFESVFHTHHVELTSVYAYALKVRPKNGLFIIIEEESVDVSYISNGKVGLHVFIPSSYMHLEQELMTTLDADAKTVQDVLTSRANPNVLEKSKKTIRHIWPDLNTGIQQKIDTAVSEHYQTLMKYVFSLIDQVKQEKVFDQEEVRICSLNSVLAVAYGYGLGKLIKDDAYLQNTLRITDESVYIDYLF